MKRREVIVVVGRLPLLNTPESLLAHTCANLLPIVCGIGRVGSALGVFSNGNLPTTTITSLRFHQ